MSSRTSQASLDQIASPLTETSTESSMLAPQTGLTLSDDELRSFLESELGGAVSGIAHEIETALNPDLMVKSAIRQAVSNVRASVDTKKITRALSSSL